MSKNVIKQKRNANKKGKDQAGFCFNKNVIISVPSPEME